MVEPLPVGYYLDNFAGVLDFVTSHYADLLTEAEFAYVEGFRSLDLDARRLYVRLCSRRGPLFRDDKLTYREIDVAAATETLLAAGYVDLAADAPVEQWARLLTRSELAVFCGDNARTLTHGALIEQLVADPAAEELRHVLPFRVLRPLHLDILQTCKLLFFGNNHQDFTEFVLRDLGISPYEQYRIHPEDRLFDCRDLLEETLRLYQLDELANTATRDNDANAMLAVAATIGEPDAPALARRAAKIRNRIARQLERLDMPETALSIYAQSSLTPCRERRARILHKQGMTAQALTQCRVGST